MANIQQEYQIGEPFNLSTAVELAAKDNVNWTWTYRTLTGFMREDGTIISAGGQTLFNTEYAEVSGVWKLNKFQGYPLKIYFCGTGTVSAMVIEHNETRPLADAAHPYEHTHGVFDSSTQPSVSVSGFYMSDDATINNKLSVVLQCAPGTYLNRIYGFNNYIHEYGQYTTSSLLRYNNPFVNGGMAGGGWSSGYPLSIDNSKYNANYFSTLSVYSTSNGTLEYIPNKNTLNPDHPQD